ncbi:50S ribosomal protein L35 [Candidatus Roizmanbacteria bacterium RIFCSPHIGHO2_01_FULL_39_12c]|uniref:Large ribosomal subunit protein bL35 n=1 Tax=Candidatus Roizmanbacteria bacterium RIFCSPHIGHO2_01_FULL_39_12c TaxID=1802031 RepID=A0A1F7G8U2_9BACT|nr:MAG: 50S ribosomal protein L35 [Candidatus Roizmanbacteria bacterium RIFCSPHIGHO2_01_FULL_39_12c]OGK46270.1 MAG: 50S ribosomal protein L35 [Candidatus Roizmanbacteria bacterium RIFCSPLOWO2_01_FULL_40_13]
MTKHRTRKSAAKRFKITKKGKVLRRKHYSRHLRAKKSKKRIRKLKQMQQVKGQYRKKIRKMLGIG